MLYEIARKGAYRRKRCVLGYAEFDKKPDVDTAMKAIGWRYFDTRLTGRLYANADDFLVDEFSISIRKTDSQKR